MTPDFCGLPRGSQPLAGDLPCWMGRGGVATPPLHFRTPMAWPRHLMMTAGLLAGEVRRCPAMASCPAAGLVSGTCRCLSGDCPLMPLRIGVTAGLFQGVPLCLSARA
jgi:hypothetical protein